MTATLTLESRDCPELAAVVDGACAFHLQFDGPPTAHIGGRLYDKLLSQGQCEEGGEVRWMGYEAAVRAYAQALGNYLFERNGSQIAWRCRPRLERRGQNEFSVYSRLAVLP